MIRTPAVAGQFYPSSPTALRQTISSLTPHSKGDRQNAMVAMAPHAGYVYSGAVAAETFARINIPPDIIVMGPNHHGGGLPLAVMEKGEWQMPFGTLQINEPLAGTILTQSELFQADAKAHIPEHSLEVQIPFLQYHREDISLVPICISYISLEDCRQAGEALARAIKAYGKPVLIVASTDMTHYESRESASRKDKKALEHIDKMDPQGLYNTVVGNRISMCGIMPTTIALTAANSLGAKKAELVRYTDSGETSGDTDHVVGYAGYIIS
jgi:hypothetical protein